MTHSPLCDSEPRESNYWHYVIVPPIMTILQLTLLLNTCLHFRDFAKIPRQIKASIFIMQTIGLLWYIHDIFKEGIISHFGSTLAHNYWLCFLTGYGDKIFPFLFYGMLILQLLLRLKLTFQDTGQVLSNCRFRLLFMVYVLPLSVFLTLWLIFLPSPCLVEWEPIDYNHTLYNCYSTYHSSTPATSVAYIGIPWVLLTNICFGLLFSIKLNRVVKAMAVTLDSNMVSNTNKRLNGVKHIMFKNTILTIAISISTLVAWIGFFMYPLLDILIYIDIFLNCLFLTLMFKYNDYIYDRVFKVCNNYVLRKYQELELVHHSRSMENAGNQTSNSVSSGIEMLSNTESNTVC